MALIVYVFLSYGPNPAAAAPWKAHAARVQMQTLRGLAKARGDRIGALVSDFAREVQSIDDLPNLKQTLEKLHQAGRGTIVIDGLGRVFARASRSDRETLAEQLLPYRDHIFDLRAGGRLSEHSSKRLAQLVLEPRSPRKPLIFKATDTDAAAQTRRLQTKAAVTASRRVRRDRADARAMALEELRQDLLALGRRARPADVAREANTRGMRTARGNAWTSSTVSQALKRLEGKRL